MDRSLDEITRERNGGNGGGRRRNNERRGRGNGVEKQQRYDSNAHWQHDKYDDTPSGGRGRRDDRRPPPRTVESSKLKVENVHYDLTEDDLKGLFTQVGPLTSLRLTYDRAGRSTGIAYVTFDKIGDAEAAIRKFDGELACGQPIHLTMIGNPAPRSLAERITGLKTEPMPLGRGKEGRIDRYVPEGREGGERQEREPREPREPRERNDRRGGRRERRASPIREGGERGERRRGGGGERRGRGGRGGEGRREPRPKKTAEDLDAEMDDYFASANQTESAPAQTESAPAAAADRDGDAEMAE